MFTTEGRDYIYDKLSGKILINSTAVKVTKDLDEEFSLLDVTDMSKPVSTPIVHVDIEKKKTTRVSVQGYPVSRCAVITLNIFVAKNISLEVSELERDAIVTKIFELLYSDIDKKTDWLEEVYYQSTVKGVSALGITIRLEVSENSHDFKI